MSVGLDWVGAVERVEQKLGEAYMPIAAFLLSLSLTWAILSVFFLLLVRIGARPVPTPELRSTPLHALSIFRMRWVLRQDHFDRRISHHVTYHLEPLTLKTTAVDPSDNSQSFRFTGFL
jgi:hypothetical protein